MLGTEDLSYISEKVPTMLMWLGTGDVGAPTPHSADVYLTKTIFYMGAAMLAYCAAKVAGQSEERIKINTKKSA